jgi:putative intracellular protease/amidase
MQIAIPLYQGFTALDAIGPYEVLSRLPGATVHFVAEEAGEVSTDTGALTLVARSALRDVPAPDVIVVPGGPGTRRMLEDSAVIDWIRAAHPTTTWTTSVCTGSLLLGAAGLLDGVDATTHWAAMDILKELGAHPVSERVIIRGKIVTAAGVSAGIDMALTLAAEIAGPEIAQAIQLGIEYDPQPPFNSGSTKTAPKEIVDLVRMLAVDNSTTATSAPTH